MNFVAKIANFWQLQVGEIIIPSFHHSIISESDFQGSELKVPVVEGKYLDLYKLHKVGHHFIIVIIYIYVIIIIVSYGHRCNGQKRHVGAKCPFQKILTIFDPKRKGPLLLQD